MKNKLKALLQRIGKDAYTLSDWSWMMVGASFLGFVVEDIFLLFTKGYANNRNMFLPFLLGYGLAILGVYLFFGTPNGDNGLIRVPQQIKGWRRIALYLFFVFLFVCVAEILLGYSVEMLCGIHYWDYINLPLHITRYTSVFTSLGFSGIITLFMQLVFTPVMNWIRRQNSAAFKVIGIVLLITLVIDYLASFGQMIRNQDFHLTWQIER